MSHTPPSQRDPDFAVDWYRVPLPADTLKRLNQRSDLIGLAYAGCHLGLALGTAGLAIYFCALGWWVPMILATCAYWIVGSFYINAIHELVHGTVFKTAWLNTFFAEIFDVLSIGNGRYFWTSHTEHHRYTLHDPYDQEEILPKTLNPSAFFLGGILDLKSIRWRIQNAWQIARFNPHRIKNPEKPTWQEYLLTTATARKRADIVRWSQLVLTVNALAILFCLLNGLWIVPALILLRGSALTLVHRMMNASQHIGLQAHQPDFRLSCRTFTAGRFWQFLYWQMNYHIEHHMYAAVPCYNLPALHKAIKPHLPYCHHGIIPMWFEIIGILYREKTDPAFRFEPEFPPSATPPVTRSDTAPTQESEVLVAPTASTRPKALRPEIAGLPYRIFECTVCAYVYDEAKGWPEDGIAPGTRWEDVPDDWLCPDCGVGKQDFDMREIAHV